MTDDIAEVAKGLTKAQRSLLMHDTFDDGEGGAIVLYTANRSSAYALNRRRLADDFFSLTPLGLRVKAYLQSKGGEA